MNAAPWTIIIITTTIIKFGLEIALFSKLKHFKTIDQLKILKNVPSLLCYTNTYKRIAKENEKKKQLTFSERAR